METKTLDNFVPQNFIFVNFYGQELCILWNINTLVLLNYPLPETLLDGIILNTPGKVKDVKCLKQKIYVLCYPTGIYKLSEDRTFSKVSASGIGIGIYFYNVLSLKNGVLYCENKKLKTVHAVCNIFEEDQNLQYLHLYYDETHQSLQQALIGNKRFDSCLISNKNNLYLLTDVKTKIIYNSISTIKNIIPLYKDNNIFGIILLTNLYKIILLYPVDNNLKIQQIYLQSYAKTLSAGFRSVEEHKIWLFYSDGQNTYHLIKNLNNYERPITIAVLEKEFLCLSLYKSKQLSGLTKNDSDSVCYFEVPIEKLEINEFNFDEINTIKLKAKMTQESETFINKISDKLKELNELNIKLEDARDLIKRINMHSINYRVEFVPNIKFYNLSGKKYIVADFQKSLPQNTHVILAIHQDCGQIFVVKKVSDSKTIVQLPLPNEKLNSSATLRVHSIVVNVENGPSYLINDFLKDPVIRQDCIHPLDKEKLDFLNSKRLLLKRLIAEKKIDMKTLSDIKRVVREELPDI